MNITKDQFVDIVESIVKQQDRDHEIAASLNQVVEDGSNHGLVFNTPLVEDIVNAIDVDGVLSWWLWDGPKHGLEANKYAIHLGDTDNGEPKRLVINNASELYDYMESING